MPSRPTGNNAFSFSAPGLVAGRLMASVYTHKMNKETKRETVNIKRWFEKSLYLENVTIEDVKETTRSYQDEQNRRNWKKSFRIKSG
jgi:hypothetical protein